MSQDMDIKLIVQHLTNGMLGEKLCRICLQPLVGLYENIFTKVCTIDDEYSIADILKELCDIQFTEADHYNVCAECFTSASKAFKFYLNAKRCHQTLELLTNSLQVNLDMLPDTENTDSLYISLPAVVPDTVINCKTEKVCVKKEKSEEKPDIKSSKIEKLVEKTVEKSEKAALQDDDDDLVIIMNEKGEPSFYKMQPDGSFVEVEYDDRCRKAYQAITQEMPQRRSRKRGPMSRKHCSKCSKTYRFVAKLRDHMWMDHGIKLFPCQVCGDLIEGEEELSFHTSTHTTEYECNICCYVFKKRNTMLSHLQFHDKMIDIPKNGYDYVCTECGAICKDEESYSTHVEQHNTKNFTCYYCGRMYKKEIGFNNHIKKHEMYQKTYDKPTDIPSKPPPPPKGSREFTCELCGRSFLGRRALLWHGRLHTNERPYKCDICGRGFVSLNRRNQHMLCSHSAPTRQCPLCPALFHMTSMVNSHIKKVHLKLHKRRSRTTRSRNVSWPTAPVPVQELSVALQHHILELQAGDVE